MAVTSIAEFRGLVTGMAAGKKKVGPIIRKDATGAKQTTQLQLASGFNQISVPTDASAVLVIFDITSTVTKTLKGPTGDTGIVLDPGTAAALTNFLFLPFNPASPPSSFGITTNGADTTWTEIVFF